MRTFVIAGIAAFSLYGCGEDKPKAKNGEIVSTIAEGAQTDAELKKELQKIAKEEEKRMKEEAANITTFEFDKLEHDFGDIIADTDNLTSFVVTNTGKKPLIIDNVKASCGCTTPQKPEKPIPPGKSDVIKVNFHPTPEQLNEIRKTITVSANTQPRLSTVSVRAFVKEKK